MARGIAECAHAHAAMRAESLSEEAVGEAARVVAEALGLRGARAVGDGPSAPPVADGGESAVAERAHRAARTLRPRSTSRATFISRLTEALPQPPSAPEWLRRELRRSASSSTSAAAGSDSGTAATGAGAAAAAEEEAAPVLVGRPALLLALAQARSDALQTATSDAAARTAPLLKEVIARRATRGGHGPAGGAGGRRRAGRSSGGGAAVVEDKKADYAAVRCVARWGELIAEAAAATAEVATRQRQLEEARAIAAERLVSAQRGAAAAALLKEAAAEQAQQ